MKSDPDYAHSWICNIAMPIFDAGQREYDPMRSDNVRKITIEEANVLAYRLMKHLFDVEPK